MSTDTIGAAETSDTEHGGVGFAVSGGTDRDADLALVPEQTPVAGQTLPSVTEDVSGIRSLSESGSVLAEPEQSGPASSRSIAMTSTNGALNRLVADVGDTAIVQQFVADYLRLLDQRITSLDLLLSGSDSEATVISLLTLETSSAMMGGQDVVVVARALRRAVEHRQSELVVDLFGRLRATLMALEGQLADVQLRPRPTPHLVAE